MAKNIDRHRRRLHIIQHKTDDYEPDVPAAPAPSQDKTTPPAASDANPADPVTVAEAQPAKQPASLVHNEPEIGSQSQEPKSKRKNKTVSPPRRHILSNRKFMNYFRHTTALAILVTFGYLYWQQRHSDTTDNSSASAEPFADWEQIAQAPAFNAEAVSISQQGMPAPISMGQQGDGGMDGIPTGLAKWIESQDSKASDQPVVENAVQVDQSSGKRSKKISKLKERSMSLWDEPGLAGNKMDEETDRGVESIASTSGIPDLSAGNRHQHRSQLQNGKNQTVPGVMESWREFRLGSGEQTTVCVVDQTVSRDTLLLSTIFANIRREWFSDVSRSQEQSLVMLIANQQVTSGVSGKYFAQQTPGIVQKQQEMERKIKAVAPSRIVYISRGKGEYGQIKFSSEKESMDAILSVPGLFRITSQKQNRAYHSGQPEQVHIELPAYSQAKEAETAQLLFTALSGEWNNSRDQASRDISREQQEETATHERSSHEPGQNRSVQTRQKKRPVEILPSPSAYRQQARAKSRSGRNSFYKLPPPPVD